MYIRRTTIRIIKCPDSHKPEKRRSVLAPHRDSALRTAGDELPAPALGGRGDEFRGGRGDGGHADGFDHGVKGECGAGFALAPVAVAAVYNEGRR